MSKLWIVHRSPRVRAALGRATGLPTADVASGAPDPADFASFTPPAAIVLGLEGDLESELDFAAAIEARSSGVPWILICGRGGVDEARRLFGTRAVAVLESPPSPVRLRAELAAVFGRRAVTSVEERRARARIAARVEAWFGGLVVPGLARALEPRSRLLPLLLRGRPGSGRSLLGRHAELSRGGSGPLLRVDARALADMAELGSRLRDARSRTGAAIATLWLDHVDTLSPTDQQVLADWIALELVPASAPSGAEAGSLRWIATAGPAGLEDRLEPALARIFAPLTVTVPPLDREGDEMGRLAERMARAHSVESGEPPCEFSQGALSALAAEPWWGERAELEAVLRATLASARSPRVEAHDLRFPEEPPVATATDAVRAVPGRSSREHRESVSATSGIEDLSLERDADPSSELTALSERWTPETPEPARTEREGAWPRAPGLDRSPPPAAPAPAPSAPAPEPTWRRLARSLAHEIRNPLVSIRTFTELLPDHHADETFRARFKELVGKDVAHIQDVVARLSKAAERERLTPAPVDVSALIDRLLAMRRDRIARARLVVLSELERDAPRAMADADALETALAGLLDRALDSLPEQGDLFIATRRIERASDGRPRLRVLLRHHDPQAAGMGGELDPVQHILEYVLAETIVTTLGGRLTIDPTPGPETLIVIDLPPA